jgi:hypothetical protein
LFHENCTTYDKVVHDSDELQKSLVDYLVTHSIKKKSVH